MSDPDCYFSHCQQAVFDQLHARSRYLYEKMQSLNDDQQSDFVKYVLNTGSLDWCIYCHSLDVAGVGTHFEFRCADI